MDPDFGEEDEVCDCGKLCKDHTDEEVGVCLGNILTEGLDIENETKKAWKETHEQ